MLRCDRLYLFCSCFLFMELSHHRLPRWSSVVQQISHYLEVVLDWHRLCFFFFLASSSLLRSTAGSTHSFVRSFSSCSPLRSLRESLDPDELYVIGQSGRRHMFFFLYSCCRKKRKEKGLSPYDQVLIQITIRFVLVG